MRGDENATYEWKAPKNGGALWVIKLIFAGLPSAKKLRIELEQRLQAEKAE